MIKYQPKKINSYSFTNSFLLFRPFANQLFGSFLCLAQNICQTWWNSAQFHNQDKAAHFAGLNPKLLKSAKVFYWLQWMAEQVVHRICYKLHLICSGFFPLDILCDHSHRKFSLICYWFISGLFWKICLKILLSDTQLILFLFLFQLIRSQSFTEWLPVEAWGNLKVLCFSEVKLS